MNELGFKQSDEEIVEETNGMMKAAAITILIAIVCGIGLTILSVYDFYAKGWLGN